MAVQGRDVDQLNQIDPIRDVDQLNQMKAVWLNLFSGFVSCALQSLSLVFRMQWGFKVFYVIVFTSICTLKMCTPSTVTHSELYTHTYEVYGYEWIFMQRSGPIGFTVGSSGYEVVYHCGELHYNTLYIERSTCDRFTLCLNHR